MAARLPWVVALSCLLVGARADAAEDSCLTCHPDVKTEYEEGVHVRQFSCTGCHGGDSTVLSLDAHNKEKSYVGTAGRLQIPALCGDCHSDAVRMKPFGLPTDQYARYYQASEHGLRLAQGDTRVAVCTDCHGTHRILPASEPTSPTAPANVPSTCGHCHSDSTLMQQYRLPANQEALYRESVHGIALFVRERPDAPTCATCHGAHGAAVSEGEAIGTVCGHCHVMTHEYFNASPHRTATAQGKMSECASCHGNHDTVHPTRALFDTACAACHAADTTGFVTGQKLKALLGRAEESLDAATSEMMAVKTTFPTVMQHRPRLQQAHAYFVEALTVQHSLDVDKVEDLTRNARSISEEVRAVIHGTASQQRVRYLGLAVLWAFLVFVVAVAWLYKREQQRERR